MVFNVELTLILVFKWITFLGKQTFIKNEVIFVANNNLYVKYFLIKKIISFFTGLPDPFAKVVVDGSGQCHSTDTVKNTLDPKWNQHYDL